MKTISLCVMTFLLLVMANVVSGESSFEYNQINGSWRIYPLSSMNAMAFSLAGKIEKPPMKKNGAVPGFSMNSSLKIVSDQRFILTNRGGTYNMWAVLERQEGAFPTNEIPHTYCNKNNTSFEYAINVYGKPDHVGYFVFPDNKKQEIYWWGPIFLMFSNDQIYQIGGWPSRIGKKQKHATSVFPEFDYEIMPGNNIVKIHNPNSYGVTIGFRSKDASNYILGVDTYVEPTAISIGNLPPGNYDVFMIFDNKPKSLFQGDHLSIQQSATIAGAKTTEIDIHLVKIVGGNYPLKQIK